MQAEAPTVVAGLYENVTLALEALTETISNILAGLGCPQLEGVNADMYDIYPGYKMAKGF